MNILFAKTYSGSENVLWMRTLTRARFTCPFYQIRFYPFGTQTCSFHMFISGTDNALTRLQPVGIVYSGKSQVGQYQGHIFACYCPFKREQRMKVNNV